ncbi:hypothetical protein [Candidatus Regiella insecticola]|uniref:hypothetical protein n=1 Tax=Candidatus Regiella insecticola TaxID=138073 RepID=UPI00159E3CDF|nr:hypothetical protein [Candidatus Regiella insecticola]
MKLPLGGQGVRPMSVDRLRDSGEPRSQQRGGFKGEGYKLDAKVSRWPSQLYLQ